MPAAHKFSPYLWLSVLWLECILTQSYSCLSCLMFVEHLEYVNLFISSHISTFWFLGIIFSNNFSVPFTLFLFVNQITYMLGNLIPNRSLMSSLFLFLMLLSCYIKNFSLISTLLLTYLIIFIPVIIVLVLQFPFNSSL